MYVFWSELRRFSPDSWVGAEPDWLEFVCQDVFEGLAAIELQAADRDRIGV
jgi:hypothetical protein